MGRVACDEGDVTNERLRYVLNMHKTAISELLKLMVKNDLLEAYGYGRGMRYRLPAKSTNMFGLDLSISGDNTICQVLVAPTTVQARMLTVQVQKRRECLRKS